MQDFLVGRILDAGECSMQVKEDKQNVGVDLPQQNVSVLSDQRACT
jgi:hypothetical protein